MRVLRKAILAVFILALATTVALSVLVGTFIALVLAESSLAAIFEFRFVGVSVALGIFLAPAALYYSARYLIPRIERWEKRRTGAGPRPGFDFIRR